MNYRCAPSFLKVRRTESLNQFIVGVLIADLRSSKCRVNKNKMTLDCGSTNCSVITAETDFVSKPLITLLRIDLFDAQL